MAETVAEAKPTIRAINKVVVRDWIEQDSKHENLLGDNAGDPFADDGQAEEGTLQIARKYNDSTKKWECIVCLTDNEAHERPTYILIDKTNPLCRHRLKDPGIYIRQSYIEQAAEQSERIFVNEQYCADAERFLSTELLPSLQQDSPSDPPQTDVPYRRGNQLAFSHQRRRPLTGIDGVTDGDREPAANSVTPASNLLLNLNFTDKQKNNITHCFGENMQYLLTKMGELINGADKRITKDPQERFLELIAILECTPDSLTAIEIREGLEDLIITDPIVEVIFQAATDLKAVIAKAPEIKNEAEWLMWKILSAIVLAGAGAGIVLGAGVAFVPLVVTAGVVGGGIGFFTVGKGVARLFSPTLEDCSEGVVSHMKKTTGLPRLSMSTGDSDSGS